jgi:hypothetical protein
MAETEILPQKIVDMRTIILKSKLDSKRVKQQGEKLKTSFFTRFGFLKPKRKDIVLVAFSKYYEPYILIGGKYSIDYCKRHRYALKVEDKTQALFIEGKKLKPEPLSSKEDAMVINLVGEEHSHYENETYVILDRLLQEVLPEKLCFAPFEGELENQPEVYFDLRKPRISLDQEITFLRSKIAKRPSDVAEIVREIFEINERTTIYTPIYELTYKNIKNGKKVTALIDGITGNMNIGKFKSKTIKKRESSLEAIPENRSAVQTRFFRAEPEQSQVHGEPYVARSTDKNQTENLTIEKRVNNVAPSAHQLEETFMLHAENATHLASDFMTRLGYKQGQIPTKLFVEGETDVVELKLQKGTARVQIDTKTKEVKEYEIQEAEAQEGFFTSKRKILLFFLSSIATIVVVLKLINVF